LAFSIGNCVETFVVPFTLAAGFLGAAFSLPLLGLGFALNFDLQGERHRLPFRHPPQA
jgi:hypothetical protein